MKTKKIHCPNCGSPQIYTRQDRTRVCRHCGHVWPAKEGKENK